MRILLGKLGIMAASILALAATAGAAEVSTTLAPKAGRKAAPDFSLKDAAGKSVTLSSFRGKPVMINLWATKCGGCVKELPSFVAMSQEFAGQGVTVVGVSMDITYEDLKGPAEAWNLVKPFAQSHQMTYPVVVADEAFDKQYPVEALPMTYLVDKHGLVAAQYEGVVDKANVEGNVRKLLAEK